MNLVPAFVLIIENHPLMREALCAVLADEADLKVGMKAANGTEALQMLRICLPDMILFAIGNPGLDELEDLKKMPQTLPEIPILAFITNEVDGQEQAALDAGAWAVLSKAATCSELIMALRELWMKETKKYLDEPVSQEATRENFLPSL